MYDGQTPYMPLPMIRFCENLLPSLLIQRFFYLYAFLKILSSNSIYFFKKRISYLQIFATASSKYQKPIDQFFYSFQKLYISPHKNSYTFYFLKLTANILAFYLLLGSFIPRTDFSQLLKLKDLQEHYQLHQLEAKLAGIEFTLQEFLYDHFIQPDGHEHEGEEDHESLPMKLLFYVCIDGFCKFGFRKITF